MGGDAGDGAGGQEMGPGADRLWVSITDVDRPQKGTTGLGMAQRDGRRPSRQRRPAATPPAPWLTCHAGADRGHQIVHRVPAGGPAVEQPQLPGVLVEARGRGGRRRRRRWRRRGGGRARRRARRGRRHTRGRGRPPGAAGKQDLQGASHVQLAVAARRGRGHRQQGWRAASPRRPPGGTHHGASACGCPAHWRTCPTKGPSRCVAREVGAAHTPPASVGTHAATRLFRLRALVTPCIRASLT